MVPAAKHVEEAGSDSTETPAGQVVSKSEGDTPEELLIRNPGISAPTYVNLLKSKGFKILREALSGSANAAVLRSKESDDKTKAAKLYQKFCQQPSGATWRAYRDAIGLRESSGCRSTSGESRRSRGAVKLQSRFLESAAKDNGIGCTRYSVALITEGLGNFRDAYFYSRRSLESMIPLFEGKKIMANHPGKAEEEDRPERDVRDIIGHYENLRIVENKDGLAQVVAEANLIPDKDYEWARALFRRQVEFAKRYPDKDLVGLSINASGDSEDRPIEEVEKEVPEAARRKFAEAKSQGIDTVKYVTEFTDAVSCDLVTEAGAGGRILEMIN
jgi:hypothetical protein